MEAGWIQAGVGCLGTDYCTGFFERRKLFAILAAVKPKAMAIILIRISLAKEIVDGDTSTECLMFREVKATACLTPTSERSISKRLQLSLKYITGFTLGG